MRFISTDWGGGGENYMLIVFISVQIKTTY